MIMITLFGNFRKFMPRPWLGEKPLGSLGERSLGKKRRPP